MAADAAAMPRRHCPKSLLTDNKYKRDLGLMLDAD